MCMTGWWIDVNVGCRLSADLVSWQFSASRAMLRRSIRLFSSRNPFFTRRRYSLQVNEDRPELDFDYFLDPTNLESIRANISNRKQVGDIDRVHELWKCINGFLTDRRYAIEPAPLKPMQLKSLWDEFYESCASLPNRSHPESPVGDESNARLVETIGHKPPMDFQPQSAEEMAMILRAMRVGSMDLCTVAGDKAYVLFDNLSVLEKALIDFSLSIVQGKHKFELIQVPDVLHVNLPRKCGLASRTDLNIVYNVKNRPDYCLSGTGEMGVGSYLENRTFDVDDVLPKRYVTVSRCYRPETARGKISKGIYRVHEFTKVEMFAVTVDDVEESEKMLQEFVDIQKDICDGLELHYKLLDMPSRELGAPAYRKFDIEAWMPGRGIYGEISSASNCTDYQSRRLRTKYQTPSGHLRFVHTINGTACAASRSLIALIEQHQKKNKLVMIPKALKPFFNDWPALYPSRHQLKMLGCNPRMFRGDEDEEKESKVKG